MIKYSKFEDGFGSKRKGILEKFKKINGKPSRLAELIKTWKSLNLSIFESKEGLIMMSCTSHIDDHLIKLARNREKFPRGFFILYKPDEYIKFFGFLPKFNNDDQQVKHQLNDIDMLRMSKKFSGSLGILIAWRENDKIYWTTVSKKSINNEYTEEYMSILQEKLSKDQLERLITYCADNNICVCGEIISNKFEQSHGEYMRGRDVVITAIGKASVIDIKINEEISEAKNEFVTHFEDNELVEFCKKFGLTVGDRYIIKGKDNCQKIFNELQEKRDFMTNSIFDKFIENNRDCINIIKGNVNYSKLTGDTLEGLIIVADKKFFKWKLPRYTMITMVFRQYLIENGTNCWQRKYLDKIEKELDKWCITEKGKEYWKSVLLTAPYYIDKDKHEMTRSFINRGGHIDAMKKAYNAIKITEAEFKSKIAYNGIIIAIIGPIGCGKTTLMNYYERMDKKYRLIDGDKLPGLTMEETMSLGEERNDYTIWHIKKALIDGKIPVISCGGYQICDTKKRTTIIENVNKTFDGDYRMILLMLSEKDIFLKLTKKEALEQVGLVYEGEKYISATERAIEKRVDSGEWKLNPKYKGLKQFKQFIVSKSKGNAKAAEILINSADMIYGYPLVTEKDYIDGEYIPDKSIEILQNHELKFTSLGDQKVQQIRYLVKYQLPSGEIKIHHITLLYNRDGIIYDNTADEMIGKILEAYYVELDMDMILLVVDLVEYPRAHVTVKYDQKNFRPVVMGEITEALREGKESIEIVGNKVLKKYNLKKLDEYPKMKIKILDKFGIYY